MAKTNVAFMTDRHTLRVTLAGAQVSDEGLAAALGPLSALTRLDLSGCKKVTEHGLHAVARLTALKELHLR